MNEVEKAQALRPAPYPSNCRACGAPIARGEPARENLRGALTCARCLAPEPGDVDVASRLRREAA